MRETVLLGDGTVIGGMAASDGDGKIWVDIKEIDDPHNSVAALIQALCAPGAADQIIYRQDEKEILTFAGYTVVDVVKMNSDGYCSARLQKPEVG